MSEQTNSVTETDQIFETNQTQTSTQAGSSSRRFKLAIDILIDYIFELEEGRIRDPNFSEEGYQQLNFTSLF